jgi:hypothetical protein
MPPKPRPPIERFMEHVVKTETCWLWTGSTTKAGYGRFNFEGEAQLAHRVSHILFLGLIPDGLTVDHVAERGCTHLNCVNPAHLEAVTLMENRARGHRTNAQASVTHCPQGHPYDEENTYRPPNTPNPGGQRMCRKCMRVASAKYSRNRRARGA